MKYTFWQSLKMNLRNIADASHVYLFGNAFSVVVPQS